MKHFAKVCMLAVLSLSLGACSDAPECWDDKVKQGLVELLAEKYGWTSVELSEIREEDSDFDSRICAVSVKYESEFAEMGSFGMIFSQTIYGRKFTAGVENIIYKVQVHDTEQHGRQAFINIVYIGNEDDNEFERYMNQMEYM